jgi:Flp pilus assembly protein TadD
LLRGAAYLPELQRATPSEALMALMGDKAADAPEWDLLDRALLQWLQLRRDAADEVLSRPGGMERFIRETGEAFRAAWRLNPAERCTLPQSCTWIREELFNLLRWAENFSLDATFDLSHMVLIAGAHLQEGNEYRFLWLRICDEAAEPRLRHRLDAALLGLACMPTGKAGGPSHDLIVGLARWALRLPHSAHFKNDVVREWRALKAAFPRQPSFWTGQWQAILDDERIAAHPFTDWLKESDPALSLRSSPKQQRHVPQLPKDISGTIRGMQQEHKEHGLTPPLWQKMKTLLDQVEHYSDATGDSYYLVTSCTNIARTILDTSPGLALTLTRRALLWAPTNGHAWSIRATALDRLGHPDIAETVLWEAMRRIPSNVVFYVELARKFSERNMLIEAKTLLRQAATLDPNDILSGTELAKTLWLLNSADEAIETLRTLADHTGNIYVEFTLGCLLVAEGRKPEASELLERCHNTNKKTLKRLITSGATGQKEGREHMLRPRPQPSSDPHTSTVWDVETTENALAAESTERPRLEKISRVAHADLLFRIGEQRRESALQLVDTALSDPMDAYAQVVKGLAIPEYREEMKGRIGRFIGSLPVRLALSPENTNPEYWRELIRLFPERQHLTNLMQLIRGEADDDVRSSLMAWCSEPTHWDNHWETYLKQTIPQYLDIDETPCALTTLVHNALTQAVDVGFDATPMVA